MTHGHRQIRNSRTIRLEGKSGLSSSRGLIRQGLGQCPAGAISARGTVAICRILYQTAVWPAPALAPAPAPAQVPAIVRKAWSVDARKDQTHAAHRPTGSKGGDTQRAFAGLLSSFDLLPCGSYGGSTLGTREHAVPHCHGSLPAR